MLYICKNFYITSLASNSLIDLLLLYLTLKTYFNLITFLLIENFLYFYILSLEKLSNLSLITISIANCK